MNQMNRRWMLFTGGVCTASSVSHWFFVCRGGAGFRPGVEQLTDVCMFKQSAVSALKVELRNLRSQLEEAIVGHKREAKGLQDQARDLAKQRESALCEVRGPRSAGTLSTAEEGREGWKSCLLRCSAADL